MAECHETLAVFYDIWTNAVIQLKLKYCGTFKSHKNQVVYAFAWCNLHWDRPCLANPSSRPAILSNPSPKHEEDEDEDEECWLELDELDKDDIELDDDDNNSPLKKSHCGCS